MRSNTQKSCHTATTRVRALLTLAGVFAVGVLSSLGIATGNQVQTAPAVEGAHQGRGMQAVENRLHAALERQKSAELGGAGHAPMLAGTDPALPVVESSVQVCDGQIPSAPVPRFVLTSAPPRAPPLHSSARA